jgi:hypothetical protein
MSYTQFVIHIAKFKSLSSFEGNTTVGFGAQQPGAQPAGQIVAQPAAGQVVVGQHVGTAGAIVAQPGGRGTIDSYAENPNSDAQLANYDPATAKK